MTPDVRCDVAVIGGGPGGSTAATFLVDAGLRVTLFERETFPRFHVGESLMPATLYLLDRLGAREAVEAAGFLRKYGASFYDQTLDHGHTFYFLKDRPWPDYSYEVPRAEFDTILLENARKHGVDVRQPALVEDVAFDRDGATLTVAADGERRTVRAGFVVDASGRDGFLATRVGRRRRVPNLGKVALFAHFRGAHRYPGKDEGNIRIFVFDDGWFWWIPLANDVTSVGAVLHAKTVRAWAGDTEGLYAEMIARGRPVADGLRGAERIGGLHRTANFAYVNEPVIGDRHLMIGDAIAFTDPIFSGGVFIAMRSGQLAAEAIARAFRDGRFEARRFRGYEREVWRGIRPFFTFIHKYYEPAFFELFLHPKNLFGMVNGVLAVLSGGAFIKLTWHTRFSLRLLFAIGRVQTWVRRCQGRPVASRLEW